MVPAGGGETFLENFEKRSLGEGDWDTISPSPATINMSWKKLLGVQELNAELDIIAEEQKDKVMGYCENCGALLVHKEGRIMKFDSGDWQRLFCSNCFELKAECQLSHI